MTMRMGSSKVFRKMTCLEQVLIVFLECILGVVTEKAKNFIKKNAEKSRKELAESSQMDDDLAIRKHRWVPVKLLHRKAVSEDTRSYSFALPDEKTVLGLGTCQHVEIGFHMKDKMLIRPYTPTMPLLPAPDPRKKQESSSDKQSESKNNNMTDGQGCFELTVKTYFPDENQPGGAMSNILDCMAIGEEIEIRGPTGDIIYNGQGNFRIEGKDMAFKRISLVLGGSGITPGYSLISRILLSDGDNTKISVVDANKSEQDILMKESLDELEKTSNGQLKVAHVLSHASDKWNGLKGHVNADILKQNLFPPEEESVVFLCGPPAMIQKAALPALKGKNCVHWHVASLETYRSQNGVTSRRRICMDFSATLRNVQLRELMIMTRILISNFNLDGDIDVTIAICKHFDLPKT